MSEFEQYIEGGKELSPNREQLSKDTAALYVVGDLNQPETKPPFTIRMFTLAHDGGVRVQISGQPFPMKVGIKGEIIDDPRSPGGRALVYLRLREGGV